MLHHPVVLKLIKCMYFRKALEFWSIASAIEAPVLEVEGTGAHEGVSESMALPHVLVLAGRDTAAAEFESSGAAWPDPACLNPGVSDGGDSVCLLLHCEKERGELETQRRGH